MVESGEDGEEAFQWRRMPAMIEARIESQKELIKGNQRLPRMIRCALDGSNFAALVGHN